MNENGVLFLLIIAAVIIVVLAVVLYWAYYQYRINKQLHDESPRTRGFLPPWAFSIMITFTVCIIGLGSVFLQVFSDLDEQSRAGIPSYTIPGYTEIGFFVDCNPNEMTGDHSRYSIDENPGYTKKIDQQGDVLFTCFIRDDALDNDRPPFIIYVEYAGSEGILSFWAQQHYYSTPETALIVAEMSVVSFVFIGSVCVLGTSTMQDRFDLTIYFYDTYHKGDNLSNNAVASGSITILLPQ